MTVLNFPASPAINDTYTENNVTYTWNGSYWDANNTDSLDNIYVEVAGDSMTGNLLLPGGGGNTAALQKQEITDLPVSTFDNDSGYITSSDIPPGTVSYWKKDGSDLKPVSDTDNVNIGDGLITLNAADGSINAAGGDGVTTNESFGISSDGSFYVRKDGAGQTVHSVYRAGSATANITKQVIASGTTRIGGLIPAAPNIELNANGSITAANDIELTNSAHRARIAQAGIFIGDSSTELNESNSRIALLAADGSGVFVGSIVSSSTGGTTANMSAGGVLIGDYGAIQSVRPASTSSPSTTDVFLGGYGINQTSKILADGTIQIGGTLPSDPAISLNADGSSYFTGQVLATGVLTYNNNITSSNGFSDGFVTLSSTVANGGKISIRGDGEVFEIFDKGPGAKNLILHSNGSISTVNQISANQANGDFRNFQGELNGVPTARIYAKGDIGLGTDVRDANTTNIQLSASGSAKFSDKVIFHADPISGNNIGVSVAEAGLMALSRPSVSPIPAPVFIVYTTGSSVEKTRLDSDGGGRFVEGIYVGGDIANGTSKISLNGSDGSIDADGFITAPYVSIITNDTTTGQSLFACTDEVGGYSPKIIFYSGGGALFKGAVQTAGGVVTPSMVLQLETDDDTKYTATTNEEGEQTLVYNGATLDVKELLVSLQTAAARIEALEARLDAAGV